MNTDELAFELARAERRVLGIQTKLHRWAGDDPRRRFDDLFNLVADPAFLLVAWDRVRTNRGACTAGVDGEIAGYIEAERGVEPTPKWKSWADQRLLPAPTSPPTSRHGRIRPRHHHQRQFTDRG